MSMTETLEALYQNSAQYRREVEANESYEVGVVHYQPTDWSEYDPAADKELLGGYNPEKVCPKCHMALAANGACTGWCE